MAAEVSTSGQGNADVTSEQNEEVVDSGRSPDLSDFPNDSVGFLIAALARQQGHDADLLVSKRSFPPSLMDSLTAKLRCAGVDAGPALRSAVVCEPVIESEPKPTMSVLIHDNNLKIHDKVPANMRNFLSRVLPEELNDTVYELNPAQASLLTHMFLRCFVGTVYTGSRMRGRRLGASFISRQTGLYNEPLSPTMLAERLALENASEVYRRNSIVRKVLAERVETERLSRMIEAVKNNDAEEVSRILVQLEDQIEALRARSQSTE